MNKIAKICRHCIQVAPVIVGFAVGVSPGSMFAQRSEPGQEVLAFTGHGGWPTGHHGPVRAVAFSPDGKRIASGGEDRVVRVWDASTGHESRKVKGHKTGAVVRGLSFSPDSRQLADCGVDGRIKVWGVEMGQLIADLKVGGMLFDVTFSPDGKRLATCSSEASVSEWDVASGRKALLLTALADRQTAQFNLNVRNPYSNYVYAVAYRPDGKQVAAASSDGLVRVWNLTPDP